YPDYISSMVCCDPKVVRCMLDRVETTTQRPWMRAITRQVHFSEWTLYGVFVDELMGSAANAFVSEEPLCQGDWSTAFDKDEADQFLDRLGPQDIAAMMSSKTGTPVAVRRAAFADWRGRWESRLTLAAAFVSQFAFAV